MIRFFKNIPIFFKDVKGELKKVSWATPNEVVNTSFVVLTGAFLLTLFIFLADIGFTKLLGILIK